MTDLSLVFVAGLLGSGHCVGMCGGFALALTGRDARRRELARQGAYYAGKTLTYMLLGAAVALLGSTLSGAFSGLQDVLSVAAGLLMLAIGLSLTGWLRGWSFPMTGGTTLVQRAVRFFAKRRTYGGAFGLGLLNGFLPCGLVYALLARAAAAGTAYGGALVMLVFGLATVPALFGVALAGHLFRPAWGHYLKPASGIVVVALGFITILRGTPAMDALMHWLM